MTDRGWFADLSDEDERNPEFPWQPFLQTDGCCFPLRIWFATKAECEDFIREDVAGRGLLDDARPELLDVSRPGGPPETVPGLPRP